MRLVLYDIPKSVNLRRGEHWGAAKRYKDYWVKMVRAAIDNSHKPCKTRMSVSISMMRKRKLDPDNLVASCKPLIDSLVYWKLIKDDSEKWIELDCRQVVGKEKITIVQIGGFLPRTKGS